MIPQVKFLKEKPVKSGLYLVRKGLGRCPWMWWYSSEHKKIGCVSNHQIANIDDEQFNNAQFALLVEEHNEDSSLLSIIDSVGSRRIDPDD